MIKKASKIQKLELDTRAENALLNNDITTVGQLIKLSEEDLLKMKGIGYWTMRTIRHELSENNFALNSSYYAKKYAKKKVTYYGINTEGKKIRETVYEGEATEKLFSRITKIRYHRRV